MIANFFRMFSNLFSAGANLTSAVDIAAQTVETYAKIISAEQTLILQERSNKQAAIVEKAVSTSMFSNLDS